MSRRTYRAGNRMNSDNSRMAFDCLTDLAAFDKSLLSSPLRLQAALSDFAPHDDNGAQQLLDSMRLGVPSLVTGGRLADAVAVLVNRAGLRVELAERIIRAWSGALSDAAGGGLTGTSETFIPLISNTSTRQLKSSGPVQCLAWPDGAVSTVVLTMDGILLATHEAPVREGRARWHLLATPTAPLSRGIAIALLDAGVAMLVWSDRNGVWGRPIRRPASSGSVEVGEVRLVSPPGTAQARYPIAAIRADSGDLDIFWSEDRHSLIATTVRPWVAPVHRQIATPCAAGERLTLMDGATGSRTSAWLACATDRGRLFLARWDVASADHDGWRPLPTPPHFVVGLAVVNLSAGPNILAASASGRVSMIDVHRGYGGTGGWSPVRMPAQFGDVVSLAADARGDFGWSAVSCARSVMLSQLRRSDQDIELTQAITVDAVITGG